MSRIASNSKASPTPASNSKASPPPASNSKASPTPASNSKASPPPASNGKASPPPDIAIIGIGCRFPGAACAKEFWDVLSNGENHIADVPADRWVADDFYDTNPDAVGKSYTKRAGFIKQFADFDHKLFGISESEAAQMDPQQRQVLECTYMAFEDAGITRQQIDGEKVGVYIGSMNSDYHMRMANCADVVDQYSVAGLADSVIANRVSYLFNLTGPSMSIDTACSSSLVAIHQAILGLGAGDCSLAICGGVSLILHPEVFTPLCKAQMLSKTGQCHAFSNDADGYTRGEGCGIVILKKMDKTTDVGNIWGTIVTGLNQDGKCAQPITAPSEKQQKQLLKDVFTTHNIDPGTVQYIEAHGTGTRRGDPVEVGAFASFFSECQQQQNRYIGSVKTNIGHLEPAAGVAGLIKVLLMMKHNTIVPSLNFDKPNELIDFDTYHFVVPKECVPWTDNVKIACLNSFGFGGANSHAVIKRFSCKSNDISAIPGKSYIVCFSGSTLQTLHSSMIDFLSYSSGLDIVSIAYTSTVCREHFKFRKAWVSHTTENLRSQIKSYLDNSSTQIWSGGRKNIVFVFCGMGTAWRGMCKDLITKNKKFKDSIELTDKSLKRFVSWSLLERLAKSYDVNDPNFGPIAIFACQVAISRVLSGLGVTPEAVVGQSIGEVAAAHTAGTLSLDEAVRVIYHRTAIMSKATGGKMLLVRNMDVKVIEEMCEKHKDKVNVGLYYSQVSCTISGDSKLVTALKEELADKFNGNGDVNMIELKVSSAFHSPHMNSCQRKLDTTLSDLKTKDAKMRMISSVNPSYSKTDLKSSKYWGENVRKPVRFNDAIIAAANGEKTTFIEIGPKPVLRAHLKDIFESDTQHLSVAPMFENSKEEDVLSTVAAVYENNKDIDWGPYFKQHISPTSVPRYSFDKKTLWKVGVLAKEESNGRNHLFVTHSDSSSQCKISIKPSGFSTVYEHKVKGIIVVPGATHAEAGFGIVKLLALGNPYKTTVSVKFSSPATLKKGIQTELDVSISKVSSQETKYTISKGDIIHAEGTIVTTKELYGEDRIDLEGIKERCSHPVPGESVYEMLRKSGFTYGETFATIDHAFRGDGECFAAMKISATLQEEMKQALFHPAVLDGMLQAATVTHFQSGEFLPIQFTDVTLKRPLQKEMFVYAKVTQITAVEVSFFLCLLTADGTILAQIRKFSIKLIGTNNFDEKTATYKKVWMSLQLTEPTITDKTKAVIFTNIKAITEDLHCTVLPLNLQNSETMETFESVVSDIRVICFVFEMPGTSPDGTNLQEELIKRITPLRLMILQHANMGLQIPFFVVMETRESTNSKGIEAATSCLNEATNAFCRCVLREYKSMNLKTVEIVSSDLKDFILRIPGAIDYLSSDALSEVLEVRLQGDEAHVCALQPNLNPTPSYRTTTLLDSAVLCSRVQNEVVEPTYLLDEDAPQNEKKDEVDFLVSTAVIHSPFLHLVTVQSQPQFGNSEVQTYPMLSLEFSGKVRSKTTYSEVIACYPAHVKQTITVPRNCTLQKNLFPQYEPGHLVKLYTLWSMCSYSNQSSVAILYVPDTEPLAKALKVLLKSKNAKSISLITPDEASEPTHQKSLIATVMLSADLAKTIAKKWKELENIVCLETITNAHAIGILTSSHWLKVTVLRSLDMFALSTMFTGVPRMLQWIKSHSKEMLELLPLLQCRSQQISEDVKPIKLSEILQTSELAVLNKEERNFMKTPSTHLIKKSRSYLVVGGLTGLGWECVSFLAAKGAGCVIILNRSKPTEDRHIEMEQLAEINECIVRSVQTDVTDFKKLEATISKLRAEVSTKPLAGIFYGAAVLRDSTLLEQTEEGLRSSLSPKVSGAWNLHVLTADLPLDFFMFHSSGTSVLGNAGQSNYGAGNGFMDELAHRRTKDGLSGQSINWGPLELGMLQNNHLVAKRLQSQGFDLIGRKDINQCLTHLLMLNEPQSIMIRLDRRRLAENVIKNKEVALKHRLKMLLEPVMKNIQDTDRVGAKQYLDLESLKTCSTEEATKMLEKYVRKLACDTAMLDEDLFEMNTELKALGVDSMYAMEMSAEIMSDTGVNVSVQEIQLQSAANVAQTVVQKLFSTETVEAAEIVSEEIVSKQTVLNSIADSFFGFDTQTEFSMGFVLVCTVPIPGIAQKVHIIKILKKCISLHKLARSTCTFTEQTFLVRELTMDQALDFRMLSGTDASEVKKVKEEPIDLETHGPIRFIFLTKLKQLIIVFHKFFFDIRAVTIFVTDLMRVSKGGDVPMQEVESADVVEEIQKVLSPQFLTLMEFWKARTGLIAHSSFVDQPTDLKNRNKDHVLVTKTLHSDFYNKITDYANRNKVTVFELLVSIYQLYLSFFTTSLTTTVTTSVDTRSYVPALFQSIGRCTNLVPLLCQLGDDSASFTDFLMKNKHDIESGLQSGLFPFGEINKLADEEGMANLSRNFLIHEDESMTSKDDTIKVEQAVKFAPHMETVLFIWQRRMVETLDFKFHLNGNLYETTKGSEILEGFVHLLIDTMDHPEATLVSLKQWHVTRKENPIRMEKGKSKSKTFSSLCSVM